MRSVRHARRRTLLLAALALLGAGAQGASAATICVQDPSCPAGGETQPTIAAAIASAGGGGHPGLDQIRLGPTTFAEGGLNAGAGNPVDIVGAGAGQTIIAPPPANTVTTLTLADPGSTVSDLTVQLAAGTTETGLALGGTARRVTVTAAAGTTGTGVSLGTGTGGTFLNGTVALPTALTATGVLGSGVGVLADSSVTAGYGAMNVAIVQRVRVSALNGIVVNPGFSGSTPVTTTVDDALVQLAGTGSGIALSASGNGFASFPAATLVARHVTAIGNGNASSFGVQSSAFAGMTGTQTTSVTVSNTILQGFGFDLSRSATAFGISSGVSAVAQLTIGSSDFDPFKRTDSNSSSMGGTASGSISDGGHNTNADPGFRNAAAGDFSLGAGSPLIDRGDPAAPAFNEPATDLAGNPRVLDGNGDGTAVTDIGAFEYVVAPPTGPPGGSGGPGGPPPRPTLGALSLTHTRFAVGPGATARTAALARLAVAARSAANLRLAARRRAKPAPHGTTIRFTLSRTASVKLTIQRPKAGLRSGRRCVAPTGKLRRAKAKRCTRTVTVFAFTRHGKQGKNAIAFSGRAGRAALSPGAYRLLATATADGLASKARSTGFTIVRG